MIQRRAFSAFINKNKIPGTRAKFYNPEAPNTNYTHLKFPGDFTFVSFVSILSVVGLGSFLVGSYKTAIGQKE